MTTKVTIEAGAHPVKIEGLHPGTNELVSSFCGGVVQPGQSWTFYAHSAMDLRVHEVHAGGEDAHE